MTRKKALVGTLVLAALGLVAVMMFTDFGEYYRAMFRESPAERMTRMSAEAAATRPRGPRSAPATKPAAGEGPTLLRELPRQAMLIAAAHEFGLTPRDRSIDFAGAEGQPPALTVKTGWDQFKRVQRVTVVDSTGREVRTIDITIPKAGEDGSGYGNVAALFEALYDAQFVPLLRSAGAKPATGPSGGGDDAHGGEVTPHIEALLGQIDPQRSFLAAAALHEAVATHGESPQRLAALVRAYSNLGESTRYFCSPQPSAFFARALVYAERLARRHPDAALSHAARGYAYTLLGEPVVARQALARARELSGSQPLPAWAELAELLARFRTRELFDRVEGDSHAPLASYFAMLSVEHSGLESITINMARLALQNAPGALRAITIMSDNGGVGLRHGTTEGATKALFALLGELAQEPAAPDAVKATAAEAVRRNFAPDAVVALLASLDAAPAPPGQLLPWSAYGSVARDALVMCAFRRLYFTNTSLGTDATERLKAWWPMVKDHRYAPALAGFDRSGELGDPQAVEFVRGLDDADMRERMPWLVPFIKKHNAAPAGRVPKVAWIDNYDYDDDGTIYETAHMLWTWGGKEADGIGIISMSKAAAAKTLARDCPDHPGAVAEMIVNNWPETRARAGEIEREMGSNPQVALALARAYRHDKRYADAARLLEDVVRVAPDRAAYDELAAVYKDQGDDEKWIAVNEQYLAVSEDFGLSHAATNEEIAYTLMRKKQFDRALKYAKGAADSYSGWGLRVYAACLTELGRYDEAERVERANQERYPDSFAWYRWCHTTGRGDLAAARTLSDQTARDLERRQEPDPDATVYLLLEGQAERTRAMLEASLKKRSHPVQALQLAMLDIEQDKPADDVERHIDGATLSYLPSFPNASVTPRVDESRVKVYQVAIEELKRCLPDAGAVPARDGAVKPIFEAPDRSARANVAYFFGRLCELRGKRDDAKWWYRASLESQEWTSTCRPQAASGLRRLGEEFYK